MIPPASAHAILAHYFLPPAQGALSLDEWERGLDAYGPRLISTSDWIERALKGTLADEVCVTFDDGLREQLLALPALERRGLTAAFNVYTGPYVGVPNRLERYRWIRNYTFDGGVEAFYKYLDPPPAPVGYLTERGYYSERDRAFRYWRNEVATPEAYEAVMEGLASSVLEQDVWITADELRELHGAGHVLGIHTHSHPTVMRGSTESQALEYATARFVLATVLGVPREAITTVSHPCGSVTPAGLSWLAANGFDFGWGATLEPRFPLEAPRWSTGYWR